MRELSRHSLAMLRSPRLILLHLVGNVVLLIAASFWLLIPDAHVWQLLLAGLSALVILFTFVWIHAGTFAFAIEPLPEKFGDAFSVKMRRLAWFLITFIVLFWCMYRVNGWTESVWQASGFVYSKMPSFLRPTSGASSYASTLEGAIHILCWYLLPCLLLPVIAAKTTGGGILRALRTLGRWRYWVGMAAAALLGVYVPSLLIGWTPGSTLATQTASLVIRLALAYVFATAVWLMAIGFVACFVGSPSPTDFVSWTSLWGRLFARNGEVRSISRYCLAVLRNPRLIVLQLMGVVVVAVVSGADTWLSWDHVWQIVAAIIGGVLLLIAFLWLQSGTLAFAADPNPEKFGSAFRFRLRRVAWALLGLVILLVVLLGVSLLGVLGTSDPASWFRRAMDLASLFLAPCLVLPWVMAKVGGRTFRAGLGAIRRWQYWVGMAVIVFSAELVSSLLPVWGFETRAIRSSILLATKVAITNLPYVIGWVLVAGLLGYFMGTRSDGARADLLGQAVS